ncbi:MAG: hypothetical protein QOD42_2480 [Sphingomonadales bacterium]|jgi:hypothetical protein|nr:hypothetical protein [Sphingomonadales bacterium]
MQIRPLLAAAASAALLTLAGCNSQPEVVNSGIDRTPPPPLKGPPPPTQTASKAYRCSDNSLFYVDFFSNNTVAVRRGSRTATPVQAVAEGGNPPYVGGGVSVSGTGDTVTINGKSCHT